MNADAASSGEALWIRRSGVRSGQPSGIANQAMLLQQVFDHGLQWHERMHSNG